MIPTTSPSDWPRLPVLRLTGDRPRVPPSDSQVLAQIAGQLGKIALILREGFRYKGGVNSDPMRSGESAPAPVLSKIGPAARGISDAVEAWVLVMAGKGKRDRTIHVFRRKVEEFARSCGWVTVADVKLADAEAWLARKRAGEPGREAWGATTADHATSILRRFGAYLHRAEGLPANPLLHLESSGEQGGDGSRALKVEEVRAMIAAARARAAGDKRQRADAALYIAFLALTGLRDGEATAIRWRDVDLTGDPPAIYTDPAWAKNRRKMRVCLNDEIRGLLVTHHARTGGEPDERVFASKPNQRTWHIIREAAGVALRDGRGRVASYHSLRKFFATALDGTRATPGVVSRLTRHAKDLTQRKYIDPDWRAELAAVSALPRLLESGNEKNVKSGLAISDRDGKVLPFAAKHAESPMVANPYNHESDTVGRPPASASLAANSDHQGRSSASDSPLQVETSNGPCQSRLSDLDPITAAFLAHGETLRQLVAARIGVRP